MQLRNYTKLDSFCISNLSIFSVLAFRQRSNHYSLQNCSYTSMISLRILQNSKVRKILDLLAVYVKLLLCLCAVFLIQCYFLWLVPWFRLLVQGIFCFKENLAVNFLLGLFMKKEGHGLQHLHCHCKGLYKLFRVDQDVSMINVTLATCSLQ